MKKILAVILVLTLLVAFSACKKDDVKETDPTQQTGATGATQSVDATSGTQGTTGATTPDHNADPTTPTNQGGTETPTTPTTQGGAETPTDPDNDSDELPQDPGICDHILGNATCTTGRVCSLCGQTQPGSSPLGHYWKDATCTAPKTCRRCGATEGNKADHEFSGGICIDCGEPDPNAPATNEDELPVL